MEAFLQHNALPPPKATFELGYMTEMAWPHCRIYIFPNSDKMPIILVAFQQWRQVELEVARKVIEDDMKQT